MQKTVTVRGAANLKVKPDYVNVLLWVKTCDKAYGMALEKAATALAELKDALKSVEVPPDNVHLTNIMVEDRGWGKDSSGHTVFKGYMAVQDIEFGFDLDRNRLAAIIYAISRSGVNPEFRVRFTVNDTAEVRKALFAQASAHARTIAEGLCYGVGMKLGDIMDINYTWHDIDICYEVDGAKYGGASDIAAISKINPVNLDASDSIVFTWELA